MAKAEARSPTMTHRIWRAHALQPHQVETFKLSRDADLNDAARLSTDPTFRLIGSPTRWDRSAGADLDVALVRDGAAEQC